MSTGIDSEAYWVNLNRLQLQIIAVNNRLTISVFTALMTILAGCGESEAAKQARAKAMLKEIDDKRNAEHEAMTNAFKNMETGKKKQPSAFDNIK